MSIMLKQPKFALKRAVLALGEVIHHALVGHMSRHGLILWAAEGGGDPPAIAPEVQALIDKQVAEQVAGLKTKNGELIGEAKKLKDQLAKFEGIDPEATRKLLQRFEGDEEAKLIAEGKLDQVIEKRTARMREDFEKRLGDATGKAEAASKRAQAFQGRVLDDAVRAAAAKAGLHQHAIEDALFRARTMFQLDEHGQAVQLAEDGKPVLGKDGKSPYTPLEWLESMKDKAPHWYPASASGGGAQGGGGGGSKTMKQSEFNALKPADRAKRMAEGYTVVE